MQLLFASNFYPPSAVGGYEQLCAEAAEGLVARGHSVAVLTTCTDRARVQSSQDGIQVHRVLHPEVMGGVLHTANRLRRRARLERDTLGAVQAVVGAVQPQAALIWGMWNVP